MNMEQQISSFAEILKQHLEQHKSNLIADLTMLLNGKGIALLDGKNVPDIAQLHFVYAADSLNIIFWAEDNAENVITAHGHRIGKIAEDNNFPQKLQLALIAFEEDNEEEADLYDFLDAFDDLKYAIVEKWFHDCWHSARQKGDLTKEAYFSIHDTTNKTKLN